MFRLRALFFIQASMRQRLSFMRGMGLSYQRELYVCIANNLGMRKFISKLNGPLVLLEFPGSSPTLRANISHEDSNRTACFVNGLSSFIKLLFVNCFAFILK